jgi:hypothetical protein
MDALPRGVRSALRSGAARSDPGLAGLCSLTADFDGLSLAGSPADFGKFMADETEKWGNVIRSAQAGVILT